ncbi:MAG: methyltransferase domain-containing protein [Acidobacteriaceae bacterium]|nr:methyltransferase domain-containing protein [Acidobacteriaceae bacterium]
MSDWRRIAAVLRSKLSYRNTFFHKYPRFDILNPTPSDYAAYDFVICSEVVEHLTHDVQRAFDNLARILRPNGFLVFSTPWLMEGSTQEHFPDLWDWKVVELSGRYVLVNRTAAGKLQAFDNLCFHGGPGQTLEMRILTKPDLERHFSVAGFRKIEFASEDCASEYGIVWEPWSRGIVARL